MKKIVKLLMAVMVFGLLGMTAIAGEVDPETYTVTFNALEGKCDEEQREVVKGEKYGTVYDQNGIIEKDLPIPVRSGYEFDGWYVHSVGDNGELVTEEISDETVVALETDITLYAHWNANSYKITFDAQGGKCEETERTVIFDELYSKEKKLPEPEKEGNEFAGWYLIRKNPETDTQESIKIDDDSKVEITKDEILYAGWEAKEYKVRFDAQGGNCQELERTVVYGKKYCENEKGNLPEPTKENYEFDGWFMQVQNPETGEIENIKVSNDDEVTITSDIVLYAQWRGKTHKITFVTVGGSCEKTDGEVRYGETYGGESGLPKATRSGYTFEGWFLHLVNQDNGEMEYHQITDDQVVEGTEDETVYAHWIKETYTIIFDAQGGSCKETEKSVIYDESYGPLPVPERKGYKFEGWYLDLQNPDTKIESTARVEITEDTTVYARWIQAQYKIVLNANGGICDTKEKLVTYGNPYGNLPVPKKEGYAFIGWYTSASGGTKITEEMVVDFTEDQTIYAHWESEGQISDPKPDPKPDPQPAVKELGEIKGIKIERKGSTKVSISCTNVENAEKYEIWFSKKKNSGYKKLKSVSGNKLNTTVTLKSLKLKAGASGYFKIKAIGAGKTKEKSQKFTYKPLEVSLKKSRWVKGAYRVSWGKLEQGITKIEIYRKKGAKSKFKRVAGTTDTTNQSYNFLKKDVKPGMAFKIKVYFKKVYTWSKEVVIKK